MKFTVDYINLCLQWRERFKSFDAWYGDWYGNKSTRKVLVYTNPGPTPYGGEDFFYVPDLNDLVRLIRQQAAYVMDTENPSFSINLAATESGRWNLDIEVNESLTFVYDAESPHEALLKGLQQMAVLAVKKNEEED
jgi:hypothetical protein